MMMTLIFNFFFFFFQHNCNYHLINYSLLHYIVHPMLENQKGTNKMFARTISKNSYCESCRQSWYKSAVVYSSFYKGGKFSWDSNAYTKGSQTMFSCFFLMAQTDFFGQRGRGTMAQIPHCKSGLRFLSIGI